MKSWTRRRQPYKVGRGWKIEFPIAGHKNPRWEKYYSLWVWCREARKYRFERLLCQEEAMAYGRKPIYV